MVWTGSIPKPFFGGYMTGGYRSDSPTPADYPSEINYSLWAFAKTDSNCHVYGHNLQNFGGIANEIAAWKARNPPQYVLLSIGGSGGAVRAPTTQTHEDNLVSDLISVCTAYNFSGIDWDLEGGDNAAADLGTAAATTRMANVSRRVRTYFRDRDQPFFVSVTPYGVPLIVNAYKDLSNALMATGDLDLVQYQFYNLGSVDPSLSLVQNVLDEWKADVPGLTNDMFAPGWVEEYVYHDGYRASYTNWRNIWSSLKTSRPGLAGTWSWELMPGGDTDLATWINVVYPVVGPPAATGNHARSDTGTVRATERSSVTVLTGGSGSYQWREAATLLDTHYGGVVALKPGAPVWLFTESKEPSYNDGAPADATHSKGDWYTTLLADLDYPDVTGVLTWSEKEERDWRLDSSSDLLTALAGVLDDRPQWLPPTPAQGERPTLPNLADIVIDDFAGGSINTERWIDASAGTLQTNGTMTLRADAGIETLLGSAYGELTTRAVFVDILEMPNNDGYAEIWLRNDDASQYVRWIWTPGMFALTDRATDDAGTALTWHNATTVEKVRFHRYSDGTVQVVTTTPTGTVSAWGDTATERLRLELRAGSSGSATPNEQFVLSSVNVDETSPLDPDITAPVITGVRPAAGEEVREGITTLSVTAYDPSTPGRQTSGIARADFQVDGTQIGVDELSPYAVGWDSTGQIGDHLLTVIVEDVAGHQTVVEHSFSVIEDVDDEGPVDPDPGDRIETIRDGFNDGVINDALWSPISDSSTE